MISSHWTMWKLIILSIIADIGAIKCGDKVPEEKLRKYLVAIGQHAGNYICTGAVIDPNHVITAGHCFYELLREDSVRSVRIIAGMVAIDDADAEHRIAKSIRIFDEYVPDLDTAKYVGKKAGEKVDSKNYPNDGLPHPKHDIALITLNRPLPMNERIGAISLPSENIDYSPTHSCEFAGWGSVEFCPRPNLIQRLLGKYKIPMPSVDLMSTVHTILLPKICRTKGVYHRDNTEFCAIDKRMESCACKGDSGAPLVCDNKLVGVLSYGFDSLKIPSIFTDVYFYKEAIERAQKEENTPFSGKARASKAEPTSANEPVTVQLL